MQDNLKMLVAQKKMSHAYLFLGSEQKCFEEAVYFAMAVNCESFSLPAGPCGHCLSCQKILHDNHPDIFILGEIGSIKIEEIRNMVSKIMYKNFESVFKVVILKDAEKMSIEAANSLLKILEEPPNNTIFLLLAKAEDSLLPTIRSRCQNIYMAEGEKAVPGEEQKEEIWHCLELALKGEQVQLLMQVDLWGKNRDNIKERLEFMLLFLRDFLVWEMTLAKERVLFPEYIEKYKLYTYDVRKLYVLMAELEKMCMIINYNVNVRLFVSILFIRISKALGGS